MNALDLARWQFGITTIYHFLFMPLSIGLSLLIAIMQTAWFRTGSPKYLAMTRFWGKVEAELAVYAGRAQRPAPVSSAFSCRFSASSSCRPCSRNSKRKDGPASKAATTKMTTTVTRTECGADALDSMPVRRSSRPMPPQPGRTVRCRLLARQARRGPRRAVMSGKQAKYRRQSRTRQRGAETVGSWSASGA
jgi:hypothetical protein